ncbi:MAG TPA: DUF6585 family protein [Thermoanaerobaculia bacterium]|nr:DUF6585 family protein [Thermoanaerobaculia bacterium]
MILSPPRETYRQSYTIRILLTLLAIGGAATVYLIGAEEQSAAAPWIAAAIIAIDVILWVVIGKTLLTIHDEGVRRVSITGMKEIEWHNLKEYRYRVVNSNAAGVHAGLIGILVMAAVNRTAGGRKATSNFYLQLVGQDGASLWVTSSFKGAYDAIGTILGKVHDQFRARVASEIAGAGAAFGPLRLSAREMQWKEKEPVPLSELAYAEIAGSTLQIKKSGKFLSVVSVRSDKVPNVLLLLEQMEKLGVGARRANTVDPLAHVRS